MTINWGSQVFRSQTGVWLPMQARQKGIMGTKQKCAECPFPGPLGGPGRGEFAKPAIGDDAIPPAHRGTVNLLLSLQMRTGARTMSKRVRAQGKPQFQDFNASLKALWVFSQPLPLPRFNWHTRVFTSRESRN